MTGNCQYASVLDISEVVQALPEISNPLYSINIEIDVCLLDPDTIESGCTKKLKSSIGITSIPDTHYVEFVGITTNLGIFTKEGVLKNDSFGYFYVYVHNSSRIAHNIHRGMELGNLRVKKYINFTDHDWVDEIYIPGGCRHRCTEECVHS